MSPRNPHATTDPLPTAAKAAGPTGNDSPALDLVGQIESLIEAYSPDSAAERSTANKVATSKPTERTPASDDHALTDVVGSAKIMVVETDQAISQHAVNALQQAGFAELIATGFNEDLLTVMTQERPDVLLVDMSTSYEPVLDILRQKCADPRLAAIPTLVITAASTDSTLKRAALDLGASDFLTMPIDPTELLPRVCNSVAIKWQREQIAGEAARFEQLVQRRTSELAHSRQQLILSLARAAEHRDNDTGNHVIRVGRYTAVIARALGWNQSRVDMLEQAAQLHDVGKIGVPDAILFKPGKLDPDEYETIKNHCQWGKEIIEPYTDEESKTLKAHARYGESIMHVRSSPMLMMASRIAQTHHENWDGSGYPLGLHKEEIPIEGRITAIADVYDALSSKRPYKEAFPHEKCVEILREQREKKFDPELLDVFFAQQARVLQIREELADPEF